MSPQPSDRRSDRIGRVSHRAPGEQLYARPAAFDLYVRGRRAPAVRKCRPIVAVRADIGWKDSRAAMLPYEISIRLAAFVGIAFLAEARGWGLFHAFAAPAWLAVIVSVIALDLAIYLQHVLFHAVPALWRLHRMQLAVVAALGAPALAVVLFEVVLNATSMFNHGNVRVPERLDRMLRWIVVTPDMHRVHHSVEAHETNSNFGFNLPWWDRMFGTYRSQPAAGHDAMRIGIEQFRDRSELRLDRMLLQPFREGVGPYPIGRREKAEP